MIASLIRRLGRFAAGAARATGRRRAHQAEEPAEARRQNTARPIVVTWEEAEQLLAAALVAGLIGQREYQDSLALLAEAEDSRRPLHVPYP
ncbi:hypothetical protein AB0C76_26270 [Kitasatospora sp. NPDC048722]|uniref:hypothetical protein n=1 Tax=Kitasatospora sp. NPDC048722 TaxID=3155639 RepID=UPI0033E81E94